MESPTYEELKRLKAYAEKFKERDWSWSEMEVEDDDGDRYVYVPQGSHLGDTLIALGDTYEDSGEDCEYIALLLKYAPFLIEIVEHAATETA